MRKPSSNSSIPSARRPLPRMDQIGTRKPDSFIRFTETSMPPAMYTAPGTGLPPVHTSTARAALSAAVAGGIPGSAHAGPVQPPNAGRGRWETPVRRRPSESAKISAAIPPLQQPCPSQRHNPVRAKPYAARGARSPASTVAVSPAERQHE